jgi:hypothetical protein
MKIFIAEGRTGEWEDRRDWPLRAFRKEAKAKEFVDDLNEKARDIGVRFSRGTESDLEEMKRFDPQLQSIDSDGIEYYYYSLDLS